MIWSSISYFWAFVHGVIEPTICIQFSRKTSKTLVASLKYTRAFVSRIWTTPDVRFFWLLNDIDSRICTDVSVLNASFPDELNSAHSVVSRVFSSEELMSNEYKIRHEETLRSYSPMASATLLQELNSCPQSIIAPQPTICCMIVTIRPRVAVVSSLEIVMNPCAPSTVSP